ncbi:hypothetical protein M3G15_06320 [Paenibacillus sp. p3-SID1389]|uniref:hypothetical protein n=1 Tax=Paenibacillus sp. p3-SID1389 TaxID=2916364 RepID=UPI0021A83493|nr:hypothetical protein [Paenibacillus sp. p3-SID1389]MCT2194751.1 hypothetical protein [Paenibacillus sp. p3-SID1389]
MKKEKVMVVVLLLMTILGCSSKDNLTKTNDMIKEYIDTAKVPVIQGLEVKEVLVNLDKETEEGLRNTVIISYTDEKGKLTKNVNTDSNVSIFYGPYDGEKVLTISISKVEVEHANEMQTKNINNLELLYTKVQDNLYIYTRHNGLSYTSEGRITNEYTEDKQFEMFAEAVGGW